MRIFNRAQRQQVMKELIRLVTAYVDALTAFMNHHTAVVYQAIEAFQHMEQVMNKMKPKKLRRWERRPPWERSHR